ncbi:MAG: hypothetical protein Q7T02_00975 [Pseudomonas sp.]|nr:hypothetical protein [Pseudomonas sp.]
MAIAGVVPTYADPGFMGALLTFLIVIDLFAHLFKAVCADLVRAPCWGGVD